MATYDMTAKATTGVNSDSIAEPRSRFQSNGMYIREAVLDFDKMTAAGWTAANGDIFQLLEIPADTMVLFAGAYVEAAADGTSPTVDIDFAEGDDIVDGGAIDSTGWLASGTNGSAMTTSGTLTFTQHVTSTDTIDVKLIAASADVTSGRIRVVAGCMDTGISGRVRPVDVDRDLLA